MRRVVTHALITGVLLGLLLSAISCNTVYVTITPKPTPTPMVTPTPTPTPGPTPTPTPIIFGQVALFFSQTQAIRSELVDINSEISKYSVVTAIPSSRRNYLTIRLTSLASDLSNVVAPEPCKDAKVYLEIAIADYLEGFRKLNTGYSNQEVTKWFTLGSQNLTAAQTAFDALARQYGL